MKTVVDQRSSGIRTGSCSYLPRRKSPSGSKPVPPKVHTTNYTPEHRINFQYLPPLLLFISRQDSAHHLAVDGQDRRCPRAPLPRTLLA